MKKQLNGKAMRSMAAMLRIVGIIAIIAVIGITVSSCDLEDLLGGLLEGLEGQYGEITVINSSSYQATVSLQGGSFDSGTVQAGGSKTFYDVPANESITVMVYAGGQSYYSDNFKVSPNGTKTLTFDGTTVK